MANLVNFKQMLADHASKGEGLPQVCLSGVCELTQLLDRLITVDNRKPEESDSQVTMRYVDEICEALGNPENEQIVKALNDVVTAFKEKICAATKSISEIRESAKKLAGYMETLKTDLLAKDPFVAAHLKLTTLSTDYPTWEWSGPGLIGSSTYIAQRINSKMAAGEDNVSEGFDYRTLTNVLLYVRKEHPITQVELAEGVFDTLVESVMEVVGEASSKGDVSRTIGIITGTERINSLYTELESIAHLDPALLFKMVQKFDGYIHAFFPTADAVANEKIALPSECKDAIVSNAQSVIALCERFAYFELMERETVMKQSILLQGGLLNADVKSEYEAEGGTQLMIAHYLRFMYKDDVTKIPSRGISTKVIVESAAHTEKVVKESMTNIAHRIAIASTRACTNAFKTVANRYTVNLVDRLAPDGSSIDKSCMVAKIYDTVAKDVAERILHHGIGFVDAALMLIIRSEYKGTFVEEMFNALGTKYLATASNAEGEVSETDLRIAEMDVVASMVGNFVVEHLVIPCKCKDMTNTAPIVPEEESLIARVPSADNALGTLLYLFYRWTNLIVWVSKSIVHLQATVFSNRMSYVTLVDDSMPLIRSGPSPSLAM